MQRLFIEASTEQEKDIRCTVIFRIMTALSLEYARENDQFCYTVPNDKKDDIEKIVDVMNEQFGIRLICRFEAMNKNTRSV